MRDFGSIFLFLKWGVASVEASPIKGGRKMILRFAHNNQPPIKTRFSFLTGIMSLFLAAGLNSCGVPQENDAAHSDAGDTGTTADGSPLDLAATSGGLVRPTGSFGPTPNEANCPYCAIKGIGEALPPMQPTPACAPFSAANTCYSVLSVSGNSGKAAPRVSNGGLGGFIFNNPRLEFCIAGEKAYPGDEVLVNGTNLSQTTSLVVGGRALPFTVKEIPSSPSLIESFKRQGLFFTLPRDIVPGFYPVLLQNNRKVKPYVEPDSRSCSTLILEVPEPIRIDTVTPLQARVGQFVSLKGTGGLKVAAPDNITPSPEIVVFFGITDEDPIGQVTRGTRTVSNSEVQVVVPFGAKRGKIKIRVGCIESTSQQIFTPLDALPPINIRPVRIGSDFNSGRQTVSPLSSAAIGNWIAVTGDRLLDCTDVAPGPAIGNGTSIGTFLYNRDEGHKCGDPVIGTDRYPLKYLKALQGLNQNFPPQAGTKVFFTSIDGWVEGRLRFDPQANVRTFNTDITKNIKILLAEVPPTAISGPIRLVTPCGGPIQSSSRLTITPKAQTPMPRPTVPAAKAPVIACGGSTSCYDQADAKRSGKARLPSGREITLVQGVGSFQVWREKDGVRILAASGLEADGWQKKLRRNGREFTQEDFTNVSVLAGRICLGHVYNFANNQSANPKCVYYSKESDSPISFWQPGQNTGI